MVLVTHLYDFEKTSYHFKHHFGFIFEKVGTVLWHSNIQTKNNFVNWYFLFKKKTKVKLQMISLF